MRIIIISTINILGIDIGKFTFHLVGHDLSGREVYRKKFSRPKLIQVLSTLEITTIAMETFGDSHWLVRKCQEFGHKALLIPPQYVKPYVKTNKNDFIDADAIAEAATRPSIRFVSVKTESSQVISVIQHIRSSYLKDKTACISVSGQFY
jgi:transposase